MMADLGKILLGGIAAPSIQKGVQNLGNASLNPNKAILDEQEMEKNQLVIEDLKRPKQMKKGGKVKSASARADGCAQRGKTKGRIL